MTETPEWKEMLTGKIPAAEKRNKILIAAAALCLMILFRILEPAADTKDVILSLIHI